MIDFHDDNDTFSVETSQLQRAGQMELVVNTNGSNEAPVSIAQCSDQTLTLATVLASSLLDHGESGLPRIDMSRFRPSEDPRQTVRHVWSTSVTLSSRLCGPLVF